jgi:transcriptional regulator with XRE-family HTH domain
MSVDDLKRAQKKGWILVAATEGAMIVRCPSFGCGLKAKIPYNSEIPQCDPSIYRDQSEIVVGNYNDLRELLRARRNELRFSIREVEEISGLSTDHIAKAEKENPVRQPNLDLVLPWAQALGYDLVLRPRDMTPYALRVIAQTRNKEELRGRHITRRRHDERRRRPSSDEQD